MESKQKYIFESQHEADTERLAEAIAIRCRSGTVIALDGDLGAGKTRFSQAFAKSIGVSAVVSSPTFTIIKEYKGSQFPLYHMDVYRISLQEADELGLDEYFYGEGISIVEWASRIEEILPQERLYIYIENVDEQVRHFHITPFGQPYDQWCITLKENDVIS